MPASKKTKKKTAKKKVVRAPQTKKKKAVAKKNVTKKPAKKATAKKAAVKKKATKKVSSKKPVAKSTKKTTKKKAAKKPATKKTVKKPQPTKKAKITKKPVSKPKKASKKPTKTKKSAKIGMTTTRNDTKIHAHQNKSTTPKFKEEKMVDTTMDELDFAPYAIERGEDYMTDEQLEHFRKILLRWKHQLMQEVDSTVGHMQEEGLSYPDPVDRASQEEGFNLELRTRDRERKLIKKIESALDSIETGDYGFCEDCGADIGVRRLEARPTATKCIDCKTYQEIRERQAGG